MKTAPLSCPRSAPRSTRRALSASILLWCGVASLTACDSFGPDGQEPAIITGQESFTPDNGDNDPPFAGPENYDWGAVPEPQLAEEVVSLDEEPCFDSLEVSDDFSETTIRLLCPAREVEVEAGDLLLSSVGSGYLLRVISVSDGDYAIHAETTPGTLSELFPDGGFFTTIDLEDPSRAPLAWGANNLYDEDGLRIRFEGASIDMGLPQLVFGTQHEGGSVVRRDLYLKMNSSISLAVSARAGAAVFKTVSKDLFTKSFPIRVVTPSFVYVGTVELTARLKVLAQILAAGQVRAGTTINTTMRVGTTYNEITNRFEDLENFETEFSANEIEVSTTRSMKLKASIDFRAEVKHYKVIGTYMEMGPYLQLAGTAECRDLDWALTTGWGGKFGAHADLYWWDINLITILWDQPFGGPLMGGNIELPVSVGGDNCDPEPVPKPEPEPEPSGEPPPDPEPADNEESESPDAGSCTPVQELACGDIISGNTATDSLATSVIDAYGINVGNYAAPELVYRWNGSAPVRFRLVEPRPTEVNHDIMIIEASPEHATCAEAESFDYGFNSVLWEGSGAVLVVVDGYNLDSGAFELEVDCNP